jgi:hypothetical protein
MSCSKSEAALRLIAAVRNGVIDDSDYAGVRLADWLHPEIIGLIASEDLLAEFSNETRQSKVA